MEKIKLLGFHLLHCQIRPLKRQKAAFYDAGTDFEGTAESVLMEKW